MKDIPDASVDMILCDLPHGTTGCKWDCLIPFQPLWYQYRRIVKDCAAIVLFGSQPFTTKLINSNIDMFKYEWIWEKSRVTGYFDVQYRPMKQHENILIFGKGGVSNCSNPRMNYFPQGTKTLTKPKKRGTKKIDACSRSGIKGKGEQTQTNFPLSIIGFDSVTKTLHHTEKPVPLLEYLINTYTKKGDLVLDNCMGSGSTGEAALKTGRQFIGMERDEKYFKVASDRLSALSG